MTRSLIKLTRKTKWRWGELEQLSFNILKIKCFTTIAMREIDLKIFIHFYTDASKFAAKLVIIQFRVSSIVDLKNVLTTVKISILYDSFIFILTRRIYSTYKKKFYAVVIFTFKFDYFCKNFYISAIIHTNHRSLTHFLSSDIHEEIYEHWANKLRRLNVKIQYILKSRNKIINVLSRILFKENCTKSSLVKTVKKKLNSKKSLWIWKNDKKEFKKFLNSFSNCQNEIINENTLNDLSIFILDVFTTRAAVSSDVFSFEKDSNSWTNVYRSSKWFEEVYELLKRTMTKFISLIVRKLINYRLMKNILWKFYRDRYLSCISEMKIFIILKNAHDNADHWARADTTVKLIETCYWSDMTQDVKRYIIECIECIKHDLATRSQSLHFIQISFSFQLLEMNFIESLKIISANNRYIFNIVCYFSRFVVSFACKNANVKNVIFCLRLYFLIYRISIAFYCDREQHFENEKTKKFFKSQKIAIDFNSSESSKSIEMIEISNRLLKNLLRKKENKWNEKLVKTFKIMNNWIILHLDVSLIIINFENVIENSQFIAILFHLLERNISLWHKKLIDSAIHSKLVRIYFNHRAEIQNIVKKRSQV